VYVCVGVGVGVVVVVVVVVSRRASLQGFEGSPHHTRDGSKQRRQQHQQHQTVRRGVGGVRRGSPVVPCSCHVRKSIAQTRC
jgi:hypothetical protein